MNKLFFVAYFTFCISAMTYCIFGHNNWLFGLMVLAFIAVIIGIFKFEI